MSEHDAAPSDAYEQLGRAFKGAMAATRRLRGRETRHPGELSYAQYSLLFGLGACGGGMSARDLALAADLSPATVTQMLDSLAAGGLVARVRSEQDRRVVTTTLTDKGHALVEGRRARLEPLWREALAEFSEDELLASVRVLDVLRGMFEQLADESVVLADDHRAPRAPAGGEPAGEPPARAAAG